MNYYPLIIATPVTWLVIAVLVSSKFGKKIQDVPNDRSLHSVPIPRIGGIGLMAGLISGWGLILASMQWWLAIPLIGLFIVSLRDDMHGLPVRMRLLAHVVAATILVGGSGLLAGQGVMPALLALILTVWMTNLYNFMDGSDGLAGGMTVFGFMFYGIAALFAHNETLAVFNFTISAATLGFLYFNFPPAKVFMGDAGSIPLGFLAAGMGIWGWQQGCWNAWFPLLVFSPFIVDASATLLKRVLRGAKITEAHREHYYQRAILLGWGHRRLALFEYLLMLASGSLALITLSQPFSWLTILVCIGIYGMLMLSLDMAWKKHKREQHA